MPDHQLIDNLRRIRRELARGEVREADLKLGALLARLLAVDTVAAPKSHSAPSRGPTATQADTLAYLASFIAEHGMPPTVRELANHFGVRSTNSIVDRLRALERKGLVRNTPRASRGWRPV